ncbi:ABC transporter substrate-binding protein [Prosthecomicrobium sp. N25]|uniref:ABC transporter substrate-binding protein n=1 Tax=Prosthecomicrobium sp. N25 TaxID=3129254 RepID=UPI003077EE72
MPVPHRRRLRRAAVAAAALAAAVLTGAPAATAQTIGFAQVGSESEWRTTFSKDMVREAEKRRVTLILADARQSAERQVATVREFIAARVDAIVIAPVVVTGWDAVLAEAKAAGIPVFIADRAVESDPSLFVARIAANFNLEGKLAGAWLAQASRGRCTVLELQGTPGSAPALERKRGFESVLAQFPGMKIVASQTGNFTREGGKAVMEKMIAAGLTRNLCAVFAHNDDMMIGAIEAMRAQGLEPGRAPLTVSVDAVTEAFRAMALGHLNATVELKAEIGAYIFDVVLGYLAGRRDYPKWVLIPSDIHAGPNPSPRAGPDTADPASPKKASLTVP